MSESVTLHKRSHIEKWSYAKRSSSVITASIENLLFCGVVFGWPSIAYVYKDTCYFIPENITCIPGNITVLDKALQDQQDLELANVLRRAVQAFILTVFLWGLLYDAVGTRKFRIAMAAIYCAGCLCATQATRGTEFLLVVACGLVQIGGMSIYTTNLKVPSLFPELQGTFIALLNGGLEASACTFLIAKYMYQWLGLEGTVFWWIWLALSVPFMLFRTACQMPKDQIIEKLDSLDHIDQEIHRAEMTDLQQEAAEKAAEAAESEEPGFVSYISRPEYGIHVLWMVILDFWNITFIALYLNWSAWLVSATGDMVDLTEEERDAHSLWINLWSFAQFIGAPMAMLVGIVMDKTRIRVFAKTGDKRLAQIQSTALVLGITSLMGVCSAFIASHHVLQLQYITFVLQLTFRACLYGNNAATLLMLYPPKYFGKLYGLTMLFTFVGAEMTPHLLQYIQDESTFGAVYKMMSALMSVSLLYPFYLWKFVKS